MSEQERAALVQLDREQAKAEYRERERKRKAAWREKNRERVNQYMRDYRQRRKGCGGVVNV